MGIINFSLGVVFLEFNMFEILFKGDCKGLRGLFTIVRVPRFKPIFRLCFFGEYKLVFQFPVSP